MFLSISKRLSLPLAVTLAAAYVASPANAAVITVTPGNMNGWTFYATNSSGTVGTGTGTGQMVNGPATPPIGTGSANFTTPAGGGDQSVQLRTAAHAGTKMADLTELKYSTYATAWNGQQLPYLTIWLDLDGNGSRDDRLWFEPDYSVAPQPPAALNTWQTWDLLDPSGRWYSDSGVGTPGAGAISLQTYLTTPGYGNATIINDAAQSIGGIRIASGFASAANNFNTYVDDFIIGTAAGTTTYDFELQDASVPEPVSLAAWSLLATAGAVTGWRKRRAPPQ